MEHSFDIGAAQKIGVVPAVLLKHIEYWICKNTANKKYFYDGCYWAYSTADAMAKMFPYLTGRQIRYAIGKLIESEILKTGCYPDSGFARATWYAFGARYTEFKRETGELSITKLSEHSDKIVTDDDKIVTPYSISYSDIVLLKDIENIKEKGANAPKKKVPDGTERERFIKPTVEEVAAYISENGYPVDPEEFINFYESKGWKIGENSMKDWRAAVRTWVIKRKQKSNPTSTNPELPVWN